MLELLDLYTENSILTLVRSMWEPLGEEIDPSKCMLIGSEWGIKFI